MYVGPSRSTSILETENPPALGERMVRFFGYFTILSNALIAYVAWTRARRTLMLVYDPASPSQFLLEAFDAFDQEAQAVVGGSGHLE